MKFSRPVRYGMIAMGHMAKNSDTRCFRTEDISDQYNIPKNVLIKIMNQFVRAGFLRSKRGPHGGFSLVKSAKEISLLEIIEAVNGSLKKIYGIAKQTKKQPYAVNMEALCTKAVDQGRAILQKAKLSDLVK